MDWRPLIQKRIAQLKLEREVCLGKANQQMAGYSAAIGELEALLTADPLAPHANGQATDTEVTPCQPSQS